MLFFLSSWHYYLGVLLLPVSKLTLLANLGIDSGRRDMAKEELVVKDKETNSMGLT